MRGMGSRWFPFFYWQGTGAVCGVQDRSAFDFILAAVHAHFHNKPAPSLLPATG